jgi:hypothetical protein
LDTSLFGLCSSVMMDEINVSDKCIRSDKQMKIHGAHVVFEMSTISLLHFLSFKCEHVTIMSSATIKPIHHCGTTTSCSPFKPSNTREVHRSLSPGSLQISRFNNHSSETHLQNHIKINK